MPNPICEQCKPQKVEDHDRLIARTNCGDVYQRVDQCMKNNHGNISSCRIEWSEFQECLKKNKADSKA